MLAVLMVASSMSVSPTWSRTFYIAENGSDRNRGLSPSAPWRSLAAVSQREGFRPGDDVSLRRGDTFFGPLVLRWGGTAQDPVVIGAYGDGPAPVILGPAGGVHCSEPNVGHIVVRDLRIQDVRDDQSIHFSALGLHDIRIENVMIDGNSLRNGILLATVDRYRVTGCEIRGCENGGIAVIGSVQDPATNGIIERNHIYDIGGDGITLHKDGEGNHIGSQHTIRHNVVHHCVEQAYDITSGTHIRLYDNEAHSNDAGSVDVGHHVDKVWIDRLYSYDEGVFGIALGDSSNVTITNSVLFNAEEHALVVMGSRGVRIVNNTILHGSDSISSIVDIHEGCYDIAFHNNMIAYAADGSPPRCIRYLGGATPTTTASSFKHNVWWFPEMGTGADRRMWYDDEQGPYEFGQWRRRFPTDRLANPRLADAAARDFRLARSSPCIDTGTEVDLQWDFSGLSRPQGSAFDVGAHEYVD
jgi:parallel beta-helix repeat protein